LATVGFIGLITLEEMTMTQTKFYSLCAQYYLEPSLALENDDLVEALQNRDDAEVERILLEEF
jgi:hypothetical protein